MRLGELEYPLQLISSADHVPEHLERHIFHDLVDERDVGHGQAFLKQSQYVVEGAKLCRGLIRRIKYGANNWNQ